MKAGLSGGDLTSWFTDWEGKGGQDAPNHEGSSVPGLIMTKAATELVGLPRLVCEEPASFGAARLRSKAQTPIPVTQYHYGERTR